MTNVSRTIRMTGSIAKNKKRTATAITDGDKNVAAAAVVAAINQELCVDKISD